MAYTQKALTPEEREELMALSHRVAQRERIAYEFEEDLMIMSLEEAMTLREEKLRQAGLK